jgi:hypothetical protein
MVPERVRVDACLADPAREFATEGPPPERPRIRLGTVLELTAGTAAAVATAAHETTLRVPSLGVADPAHFMLRTAVGVLGRLELGDYESGITYPVFRHDLGRLRPGQSVRVAYRSGQTPRFECRLI